MGRGETAALRSLLVLRPLLFLLPSTWGEAEAVARRLGARPSACTLACAPWLCPEQSACLLPGGGALALWGLRAHGGPYASSTPPRAPGGALATGTEHSVYEASGFCEATRSPVRAGDGRSLVGWGAHRHLVSLLASLSDSVPTESRHPVDRAGPGQALVSRRVLCTQTPRLQPRLRVGPAV